MCLMTRYPLRCGGGGMREHVRHTVVPSCFAMSLATGECQHRHSQECLRINQLAFRRQTKGLREQCAPPLPNKRDLIIQSQINPLESLSPTAHFTHSHSEAFFFVCVYFFFFLRRPLRLGSVLWQLYCALCNLNIYAREGISFVFDMQKLHFVLP